MILIEAREWIYVIHNRNCALMRSRMLVHRPRYVISVNSPSNPLNNSNLRLILDFQVSLVRN